jgi:transcriptional regulator with XRE-family HTH domain
MSEQHNATLKETLAGLPIHERIRELREERQLPAYRLAEMARISASYLSLIESGEKVPSEEVAVAIATALGDDPDLYRGWSHAGGREGLGELLSSLRSYARYTSGSESDEAIAYARQTMGDRPGDQVADLKQFLGDVRESRLVAGEATDVEESAPEDAVIRIPLFEEDADPAANARPIEIVHLDRRMLPAGGAERPFAYRPGPEALSRAGGLIEPGELVVLSSRPGNLDPQSVHAVRFEGRIVLSRVLFKGNALLLLPPEGSSEFDIIEIDDRSELDDKIAGTVVLTVRDWGAKEEATPPMRVRLGARLDDGDLPETAGAFFDATLDLSPDVTEETAELMADTASREPTRAISAGSAMPSWSLRRLFGATGRKRPKTPRPYGRSYTLDGDTLVRRVEWKDGYGWRPTQRPEDLRWLEAEPSRKIRFELARGDEVLFHLEMGPGEWRDALGDYGESPSWPRHGYITSITKMRDGEYTEEFKDRWAAYVKRAD